MDELFADVGKPRAAVFKDKSVLSSTHLLKEEELVDREKERDAIADYIKRTLAGQDSKVLIVNGPSGSGKTALGRFILHRLQVERIEKALPMYVDCIASNSQHSILTQFMRFFRSFYEGKGRSRDEICEDFVDSVKGEGCIPVIILDNFDRIVDLEKTLWRMGNLKASIQCGLILITPGKHAFTDLHERLKSGISLENLAFKPYCAETLFEIMKARVRAAFVSRVPDDALSAIAKYAADRGGNAKLAFNMLAEVGELAQWNNSPKLMMRYVEEVIQKFEKEIILDRIDSVKSRNEDEFKVLQYIAEREAKESRTTTGELEQHARQRGLTISGRTLRNYIEDLEKRGLIIVRLVRKGMGRTSEIALNTSSELILYA